MVKTILILGAGFAGLKTAKDLSKKADPRVCKIILVDKNDFHIYTPDLYEIASSFRAKISDKCLLELKDSVATNIYDIIDKNKVEFIRGEVIKIDPKRRMVLLKGQKIKYDCLVVALGSLNNTYGIPGLDRFSYAVKTVRDAIILNCHIDTYLRTLWRANAKKNISINIGGGGATGVEFAGELISYVKFLCEKYKYPTRRVKVTIIQGSNELIGLGKKVSDIAVARLNAKGVDVIFDRYINKVSPAEIELKSGSGELTVIPSDLLVWTGGVKVNDVVADALGDKNEGGAVAVDRFLQSKKYRDVFAVGDNAAVPNKKTGKRVPMLARYAFEEGALLAENLCRKMRGRKLLPFRVAEEVVIIPIAGKFGILKYRNIVISGKIAWYCRRLVDLWYCLKILPVFKALKKWRKDTGIFVEND
ncbi:NAD(P)/FAD-dependent oxidoreductase [Candidatus Peregrinibacteria bacterium]|nr:NAD(P)/FAD-dependent oxidoreductase [Candidatus Peregrinibacteria bacterium]